MVYQEYEMISCLCINDQHSRERLSLVFVYITQLWFIFQIILCLGLCLNCTSIISTAILLKTHLIKLNEELIGFSKTSTHFRLYAELLSQERKREPVFVVTNRYSCWWLSVTCTAQTWVQSGPDLAGSLMRLTEDDFKVINWY